MDDPKAINAIRAKLDETWLSERALAAPSEFYVAVSVICDLKCPYCPRQVFPREKVNSGVMPERFWRPLVPWMRYAEMAHLFGLGEPFLFRHFFEWHAEAKAQGARTATTTHGMSLNESTRRRLLDSGLDTLMISIDGATPATFNHLRAGADFETVCENLRRLVETRDAEGRATPAIIVTSAISRHNLGEILEITRLARRLGAESLAFSNLIAFRPEDAGATVVETPEFREMIEAARRIGEELGLKVMYTYQKVYPWKEDEEKAPDADASAAAGRIADTAPAAPPRHYGCPLAWRTVVVERDGALKPCCYLEEALGNVGDFSDFGGYINSPAPLALRRSLIEGRLHRNCRGCGQLASRAPAEIEALLAEARRMIAAADLSPATRATLAAELEHYESLARERSK